MSKKTKYIINYALTFIFIFIVPNALYHYFSLENDKLFYKHVSEDEEICYQRAKRDSVDTRWCSEISNAAQLAYSRSSRGFNISHLLLLISPLLFVLIIGIGNLRNQVEELKEKVDV